MNNDVKEASPPKYLDLSSSPKEKKLPSIVTFKKSNFWSNSGSFSESPSSFSKSFGEKKISDTNNANNTNNTKQQETKGRNLMSFKTYISEEDEKKNNFQEDEILPNSIEGVYYYDYNILKIHEILKKKFAQEKKKNLTILKDKLQLENNKILGKQNLIERKASRKKIEKIEEEILDYENNTKLKTYLSKSKSILKEYKKLGSISTIVSFVSNTKEDEILNPEDEEKQMQRHKIIFDYFEIARKYIPIDLIRKIPDVNSCIGCGNKYDEMEMISDESGSTICPTCGLETINIVKTPFYSDSSRLNNSRNNYEDRANFEKVLMRYQGKQITKPGKELYEKLDEYFISKGLLSSKEYQKLPLKKDGTKEGTNRDMMFEALNNINCSGYYDDINLICSIFFGWSLPDITYIEEEIMHDYDESQKVYESLIDREGRKSSLNSQFRLYCLLKKRGIDCKFRDFKIPSTPSILEYHKIIWKQICQILGWEYIF